MLARRADPIVAVATAPGRGAIGVVRVSGEKLDALIEAVCGRRLEARRATYVPFLDADGGAIDRGIAVHYPGPHSATGEDVLELQAHGGEVVLRLIVDRCLAAAAEIDTAGGAPRLAHLRPARAGEFTERAFLNDKLDLAQAEAVADLIDAGTEAAARAATRSLDGAFSAEIDALVAELVELRMLVEATLDFPDEEAEFLARAGARDRLAAAVARIEAILAEARRGVLLRDGLHVVIAGQPNVGKSSLLNALAGAELAIVTEVAGTTRDKVGAAIQIDGVPVHVVDTAGLRQSADAVERIGIERAWAAAAEADVALFLHDLTRLGEHDYDAGDAAIAARLGDDARVLHVFNKMDVAAVSPDEPAQAAVAKVAGATADAGAGGVARGGDAGGAAADAVHISALTGAGLDGLRAALLQRAGAAPPGEGVGTARARHVDAVLRSRARLHAAIALAERGDAVLELVAEELRGAHDALAEITGAFAADDLLGVIFARFCIGK